MINVDKLTPRSWNSKTDGVDTLSASEWNSLNQDLDDTRDTINDVIDTAGSGGGSSDLDSYIHMTNNGNLCIETTDDNVPSGKNGKINIESKNDIQLKPGDDISLYSHHRAEGKRDEVAVKILDGEDKPVKLQINASEMTITTKDKEGSSANVFDVNVNSGKNVKGYLKVRAQAIDLRCEDHGGIAIQPKGYDNDDNMNKIKFEHGGGDGLEFGTFNSEKTSIFTNEYRFNKDGVWKMATRTKEVSDKYDGLDETTHYKYVKNADDFYDFVDNDDEQATTEDIIKTANAFNGQVNLHTHITSKGNLEIESSTVFVCVSNIPTGETVYNYDGEYGRVTEDPYFSLKSGRSFELNKTYKSSKIDDSFQYGKLDQNGKTLLDILDEAGDKEYVSIEYSNSDTNPTELLNVKFKKVEAPNINLESDNDIKLSANKIKLLGELVFTEDSEEEDTRDLKIVSKDVQDLLVWAKEDEEGPLKNAGLAYLPEAARARQASSAVSPIIKFEKSSYVFYVGEDTEKVRAVVTPSSLQSSITYSSSDPTGVTVDANQFVEGLVEGTYYIKASFAGDSSYSATEVTVPVTVLPARDTQVTLTMSSEGDVWTMTDPTEAVVFEVTPSEPIQNAFYNWSTIPAGIGKFEPVAGDTINSRVVFKPNSTYKAGTIEVWVDFYGNDYASSADASHSFTLNLQ